MRLRCIHPRRAPHGFTYIGLLIVVALIGIALAGTAEVVSTEMQREREQELLFVGAAYADALDSYAKSSPGQQRYPAKLEHLLIDPRFPNVRRHIRRLYRDPITQSSDWGIVLGPHNGIVGVYSKSEREPLKRANFPKGYERLAGAKQYLEWQFTARALTGGEDAAAHSDTAYDGAAMKRSAPAMTFSDDESSPFGDSGFGSSQSSFGGESGTKEKDDFFSGSSNSESSSFGSSDDDSESAFGGGSGAAAGSSFGRDSGGFKASDAFKPSSNKPLSFGGSNHQRDD